MDWHFNAWGGLYSPCDADDRVASVILEHEHVQRVRLDNFVAEGGSIHVDGEGCDTLHSDP